MVVVFAIVVAIAMVMLMLVGMAIITVMMFMFTSVAIVAMMMFMIGRVAVVTVMMRVFVRVTVRTVMVIVLVLVILACERIGKSCQRERHCKHYRRKHFLCCRHFSGLLIWGGSIVLVSPEHYPCQFANTGKSQEVWRENGTV